MMPFARLSTPRPSMRTTTPTPVPGPTARAPGAFLYPHLLPGFIGAGEKKQEEKEEEPEINSVQDLFNNRVSKRYIDYK